jgi:hypothetical protein
MQQHIGRPLSRKETVHHKNGDTKDNRIENLELWDGDQPPGQRLDDKAEFYIDWLAKYYNLLSLDNQKALRQLVKDSNDIFNQGQ